VTLLSLRPEFLTTHEEVHAEAERKRAEEEAARKKAEAALKRAEEEAARKKAEAALKRAEEEAARKKAEEEAERKKAEAEAKRRSNAAAREEIFRLGNLKVEGAGGMEMIKVSPGEFLMGSPWSEKDRSDDELQHRVRLTEPFWLGKYPVTQKQWKAVMGNNPSHFQGDNLPVEMVSWEDAMEFCRRLTEMERTAGRLLGGLAYSLPTEAQWEYACRAGTTTAMAFGYRLSTGYRLSSREANFHGNYPYGGAAKGPYLKKTTPVGSYRPNAWGFYDLHGNVWEWCADRYGAYPSGSVTDPTGPSSGTNRVHRGGGWYGSGMNCRSAYRNRNTPGGRLDILGFRPSLRSE
jgi:sulfatase modifying factor 1